MKQNSHKLLVMFRFIGAFVVCLSFFIMLPKRSESAEKLGIKSQLNVYVPSLPEDLSLLKVNTVEHVFIVNQIFDKLFTYQNNNEILPVLASKIIWCPKQYCLRIKVRNDKKFHDGTLVTPEQVVLSFTEVLRQNGKKMSWAFGLVRGFDDFVTGKTKQLEGLSIEKDGFVRFDFTASNPLFIQIIAGPFFYIFKKEKNGLPNIGSGAYKLSTKDFNAVLLEKVNKDSSAPSFLKISDHDQATADIVFSPNLESQTLLDHFNKVKHDTFSVKMMLANLRSDALAKKEQRCLILSSVARAFKQSFEGSDFLTNKGIPFSGDFNNLFTVTRGSTAAISFNDLRLNVLMTGKYSESLKNNLSSFVSELKKNKIIAKVALKTRAEAMEAKKIKDFEIVVLGYSPDYPHPDAILTPFLKSGQQFNWSGFENKRVDQLLEEARLDNELEKQNASYREVIKIVEEQCPVVFLGYTPGRYFVRKGLKNPKVPTMGWYFWNVTN